MHYGYGAKIIRPIFLTDDQWSQITASIYVSAGIDFLEGYVNDTRNHR